MRSVTFAEIVPGMVLYPKTDVNPPEQIILNECRIIQKIVHPGEESFWGGDGAMYFLDAMDAHLGICSTGGKWVTDEEWWVIDKQETLDELRRLAKKAINDHRDNMDESERLVDANL